MSKVLIFALTIMLGLFGSANACSCVWDENVTVRSHAAKKTAIFKGEYLGERKRSDVDFGTMVTGEFRVIEVLKGEIPATADLQFLEDDGANCGMRLEIGVVYEVFAYDVSGDLRTDDCSGTRKADTASKRWSWKRYRKALRK